MCVCVCNRTETLRFSSTIARFPPNFGEERLVLEFDGATKWKPLYSLLSGLVGEVRVKDYAAKRTLHLILA